MVNQEKIIVLAVMIIFSTMSVYKKILKVLSKIIITNLCFMNIAVEPVTHII